MSLAWLTAMTLQTCLMWLSTSVDTPSPSPPLLTFVRYEYQCSWQEKSWGWVGWLGVAVVWLTASASVPSTGRYPGDLGQSLTWGHCPLQPHLSLSFKGLPTLNLKIRNRWLTPHDVRSVCVQFGISILCNGWQPYPFASSSLLSIFTVLSQKKAKVWKLNLKKKESCMVNYKWHSP